MDDRESEIYREARKRVHEKAKFFKHLYTYIIVNMALVVMALFRGRPIMFFPVPLFWGVGLAFHYLKVFGIPGSGVLSKEWEDKETLKEMEKMTGRPTKKQKGEQLDLKELRKNYDESDFV